MYMPKIRHFDGVNCASARDPDREIPFSSKGSQANWLLQQKNKVANLDYFYSYTGWPT